MNSGKLILVPGMGVCHFPSVFRRFWPVLPMLMLGCLPLWAAKPQLTSDEPIVYDGNEEVMLAKGNAKMLFQDFSVVADEIYYYRNEAKAEARNNVQMNQEEFRLISNNIVYNLQNGNFEGGEFRAGDMPLYVQGKRMNGDHKKIHFHNVSGYYKEPFMLSPNIWAKEYTLHPGNYAVGKHIFLRIGKIPLFYWPYAAHKVDSPPIRIRGDAGSESTLGRYAQSRILMPFFDENLWLGGNIDYYTKRGVLYGPAADYQYQKNDLHLSGTFDAGYIADRGDRKTDVNGKPIAKERFFIDSTNQITFDENFRVKNSIYWWSDSEVERDFRQRKFKDNQFPDNFVEGTYAGSNYVVSAFTRVRINEFQRIQQRLPEIRIDYLPTNIGETGLYHRGYGSMAYLKEKGPTIAATESTRLDTYYGIEYPIHPNNWLNITPVAGGRMTHYFDPENRGSEYTRFLGQVGFDAQMDSYGLWEYENKVWKINGLRHKLTPILQYRYLPKADQGQSFIPEIDKQIFNPNLPIMDLGQMRTTDEMLDQNLIRVGLENSLDTRDPTYGSRNLVMLNFYQDVRVHRNTGDKTLSDFYTYAKVAPAYWLDIETYSRIDPHEQTLQEFWTRTKIQDAESWGLSLSTNMLQGQFHQYTIKYDYKLTERMKFFADWHIDGRLKKLTQHSYKLNINLHNVWRITPFVTFYDGSTRRKGPEFKVTFDLISF